MSVALSTSRGLTFIIPGYEVSVFASSVVPETTVTTQCNLGNNLYGVYGSFQNIVPKG